MDTHYFLQDAQGAYYPINGPTMIGRDPTCQIRLSDPEVSRNHALLWIQRGILYIRDEGTRNGIYLNELPIPPNQAIALSIGSQLRLGNTFFTVVTLLPASIPEPVAAPVPAFISTPQRPSKFPFFLILLLGALCLGLLALAVGYFLFRPRASQATPETFPGMTIVATTQPQPLLAPKEFSDASKTLALSVACLNTAELVFIKQAQAANPVPKAMNDALREVAAQAMNVALLAEKQGYNAASQGGSSADQYYSIARLGYALVIEAQNLREGLQKQSLTPAQALKTITQYGARLWNPMVSDPVTKGNPFLSYAADIASPAPQFLSDEAAAQLKTQLGSNELLQVWMASAKADEVLDVFLPGMGRPLTQPPDPKLLQNLTQASGQVNANQAQLAAAAKLAMLLPYSEQLSISDIPFSMQVEILSGVAIADGSQVEAGKVPTFPKGQASVLAKQAGAGNEFVENVYTLAGDAPPIQTESISVKETQPLVTLQITGAKETSRTPMAKTFGDLIQFEVQISWQSTLAAPMLDIGCLGGSSVRVTGQSGSIKVDAASYANPQTQQATISCRASRPADFVQSLSEMSMQVSVNSSANVEQAPPPTVTATLPPTVTQTLEPSETPTPNKAQQALSTEVVAQKTAEFQGTITAIAAQTEQAAKASIFTMNGTFGLSHPDDPCNLGPYSSGTLQITVNFGTGAANGTLTGGGSSTRTGLVCGAMKFDVTCNLSYTGGFSGAVDPASGAFSMRGNVSGSQSCTFSNCSQDGVEFACSPGSSTIADSLTITGTVFQSSGAGNGALQTCAGCSGDWSAGK